MLHTRLRVVVVASVVLLLGAASPAVVPHTATAEQRDPAVSAAEAFAAPGRHMTSLPFSDETSPTEIPTYEDPVELNRAVADRCNGGVALTGRRWYSLPTMPLGTFFARGDVRISEFYATSASTTSGLGLVDYGSGEVLTCGATEVSRSVAPGATLAVVLFWDAAELADLPPGDYRDWSHTRFHAARTTGVPPNDDWGNAAPITTTPFTATADSTFANDDEPALFDPGCGMAINGTNYNSVWWKYTPTTSGLLSPNV